MQANKERLNVLKAAKALSIPYLIIHGTNDEAVDKKEAEQLHHSAKNSKLLLVAGASHTFGVSHPFTASSLPEHAQQVIQRTIAFFK